MEEYQCDGKIMLQYSCGSKEVVDPSVINWRFARKNGRTFIPSDQPSPPQPKNATTSQSPQYVQGLEHKCINFTNFLYFTVSAASTSLFRTGGTLSCCGGPVTASASCRK